MTGDGDTRGRCFGDLPGAIYRRCSSFYDQARFAAVCTSGQPKRPALPILLPSTGNGNLDWKARAYSPEDGRVLRAWLPPYGKRIVGCYDGGWVAAATGSRINIVNLFSSAWVLMIKGDIKCRCPNVPRSLREICIEKVVFSKSKDPSTHGCIMAAMTTGCAIAVCGLGLSDGGWITLGCETSERFIDIAFCNGDLYGLSSRTEELYTIGIRQNEHGALVGVLLKLAITSPIGFDPLYIFQLGGKLATAVNVPGYKAQIFMVFELAAIDDDDTADKYTWAEVTSLGDHALFLGPGCCKAVQVSAVGRRGGVEGNRIYYSKQECQLPDDRDPECLDKLELGAMFTLS